MIQKPPARRLAPLVLAAILVSFLASFLASCGTPAPTQHSPVPKPSPSPSANPSPQLGPGGLTLDQEIGAALMAGFQGPLSDAVLADWQKHQFGGLLIVNLNHNADSAAAMTSLISG